MITIEDFILNYVGSIGLKNFAGKSGLNRKITVPELERPGLALTGFLEGFYDKRILVFGKVELSYLCSLPKDVKKMRLSKVLTNNIPMVILARDTSPSQEMIEICNKRNIPLFSTPLITANVLEKITYFLGRVFSESMSCAGTLVEAYGKGVLIQGDSSVGKSETALGLIERQHRLVSDDVVIIKKREGSYLEGEGPSITRHLLEIRGIGIINVADLYGVVCVSEKVSIDLVVKLESWNDDHFYDRVGLEEKHKEFLSIPVPYYVVPVKPGRDVVLLIETIVLNHRLKKMGVNSARDFNRRLLATIAKKQEMIEEST